MCVASVLCLFFKRNCKSCTTIFSLFKVVVRKHDSCEYGESNHRHTLIITNSTTSPPQLRPLTSTNFCCVTIIIQPYRDAASPALLSLCDSRWKEDLCLWRCIFDQGEFAYTRTFIHTYVSRVYRAARLRVVIIHSTLSITSIL